MTSGTKSGQFDLVEKQSLNSLNPETSQYQEHSDHTSNTGSSSSANSYSPTTTPLTPPSEELDLKQDLIDLDGEVVEEDNTWAAIEGEQLGHFNLDQNIWGGTNEIAGAGAWAADEAWSIAQTGAQKESSGGDWNAPETQLRAQAYSTSLIIQKLTEMKVLLPQGISVYDFERIEDPIKAKIEEAREVSLRRTRHQRTILIDTEAKLRQVLDKLEKLDHSQPQVVVDFEGLNFKRTGTVDIVELFIRPQQKLYLVDVVALKKQAWSMTATSSTFCLETFLSSSDCRKIMWDLRMDAHIMNKLYGIRLAGIIDCSLWAVAYRSLHQLDASNRICIEHACKEILRHELDQSELVALQSAKDERNRLPPRPWAIRPLPTALIDYAADVKYMGMLYDVLSRRLKGKTNVIAEIEYYTEQELEIASDPFWQYAGDKEPYSPWCLNYLSNSREALQARKEYAAAQREVRPRVTRWIAARAAWVRRTSSELWWWSSRFWTG